jgi:DNA-binding NarL/FixJ family response regulator
MQPSQTPSRRPLRVFLVEDLPVVRNRVIESLQEIEGVEVAGYAEGEDSALSWLQSHACDVLIVDLQLSQGNGLGVLQHMNGHGGSGSRLPVKIVYSNHVSANIRRLAAQFGAAYFFDKTLDTPKLRGLLEDLSVAQH